MRCDPLLAGAADSIPLSPISPYCPNSAHAFVKGAALGLLLALLLRLASLLNLFFLSYFPCAFLLSSMQSYPLVSFLSLCLLLLISMLPLFSSLPLPCCCTSSSLIFAGASLIVCCADSVSHIMCLVTLYVYIPFLSLYVLSLPLYSLFSPHCFAQLIFGSHDHATFNLVFTIVCALPAPASLFALLHSPDFFNILWIGRFEFCWQFWLEQVEKRKN